MKFIQTDSAPTAIGPYSQGIEANGFIFCSGQIGLDPMTGNLEQGIIHQTRKALQNLEAVLRSSDSDLKHVIKTTVYMTDIEDFKAMNEVYEGVFDGHKPARATVGVATLPKGALVEVECIAVRVESI